MRGGEEGKRVRHDAASYACTWHTDVDRDHFLSNPYDLGHFLKELVSLF